jgi:hypothetical protein
LRDREVFLKGKYLELGMNSAGTFGTMCVCVFALRRLRASLRVLSARRTLAMQQ